MFSLNVNFVEWPIWSVNVCLNHLAQMLPALYKSLLDCLIQLQLRNHFGWLLEISHLSHIHTLQWFLSSWQSPTWCSSPWGQGRGWTESLAPVTLNTGWWLTTGASTASTSTPSPSTSGFTASCSSSYPVSSSPSSPLASSMPCTRHVKQLWNCYLVNLLSVTKPGSRKCCKAARWPRGKEEQEQQHRENHQAPHRHRHPLSRCGVPDGMVIRYVCLLKSISAFAYFVFWSSAKEA